MVVLLIAFYSKGLSFDFQRKDISMFTLYKLKTFLLTQLPENKRNFIFVSIRVIY